MICRGCSSPNAYSVAAGLGAPVGADKALTFWVRTIPENPNASQDVYVRFGGTFFKSGNFAGNYNWQTTTRIDEFSKIAIPITDAETDSLVISIWGGSISSAVDACENRSFAWIDDIKIEGITRTHTNSFQPSEVLVYPNPSDGLIHIAPREQSFDYFQLLDAAGRVAMQGAFTPTLEIKTKGLFFLRLTNSRSGHSFTTPIAVY